MAVLRSIRRSVTRATVWFRSTNLVQVHEYVSFGSAVGHSVVVPGTAVAFDQGHGLGWSPGAGDIGLDAVAARLPGVEYAFGPAPCRFDLVAAHEQGRIAAHH